MMKYLMTMVSLVASMLGATVYAQAQQQPKLSPLTKLYLLKIKKAGAERFPDYVYRTDAANNTYLRALIKVTPGFSHEALNNLGISVGTKAGNIWTTQIPVANVEAFTKLAGIEYIQLDEPCFPTLDSARRATRADSVQAGYGLPMPYSGDGVVVGIIDAGFDYSHPSLFDTNGVGFRVKKVWEQQTAGTPPSGFAYGRELTDSLLLWAAQTDNGQTHGTHVAGIAAGSGYEHAASGSNLRYRGMAYRSDLVFVGITPPKSQWINTGCSDMVDGMNYIYSYAAAQGKPAVANLSWGSPLGPRDGSGLFSQACDNLTGNGKIFVCSAGNNGDNRIHIKKIFSATDTIVKTFLNIEPNPLGKTTWVDAWGDTAKSFCVNIKLHNTSGAAIDSTGFICLDDQAHSLYLIGSNNDTCFINVVTSSSEFNMKPRIFIDFRSKVDDAILLTFKGHSGTINFWNSYVHETTGYYGSFSSNLLPGAVNGSTDMTISDIAASRSAITVGAYASKVSFTNVSGGTLDYNGYVIKGRLAPFSSRGPTADGRVKPDITGPGMTLASAVSSYDTGFTAGHPDYNYVVKEFNNPAGTRSYAYAMLSGTSMSSPSVSGIVALMLQANPQLDPQQVKDVFTETAIKDNATGNLPAAGNNNWGHGKVNAYGAVKKSIQLSGVGGVTYGSLNCNIYPNPNHGDFTVEYEGVRSEELHVQVYDVQGRMVMNQRWHVHQGYNTRMFTAGTLARGSYFTKLSSGSGYSVVKMAVE